MTDSRVRELERAWQESGSPHDLRAWIHERVRMGELPCSESPCPACGCVVGLRAIIEDYDRTLEARFPKQVSIPTNDGLLLIGAETPGPDLEFPMGPWQWRQIHPGSWERHEPEDPDPPEAIEEICAACGVNWFPGAWNVASWLADKLAEVRASPIPDPRALTSRGRQGGQALFHSTPREAFTSLAALDDYLSGLEGGIGTTTTVLISGDWTTTGIDFRRHLRSSGWTSEWGYIQSMTWGLSLTRTAYVEREEARSD